MVGWLGRTDHVQRLILNDGRQNSRTRAFRFRNTDGDIDFGSAFAADASATTTSFALKSPELAGQRASEFDQSI